MTAVDTTGPTAVISGRRVDGRELRLTPRLLVDASGQAAVLGRDRGLRRFNEFFKNLAIFGYFRGAERLPGELQNHILSAAFGDGWFWYIPLHDGTMSVGAVVDVRRWRTVAEAAPAETYRKLIAACPEIADRLRAATLASPIRIIRDYSYDSTRFWGPGWLLAGDAACFIDPVFSTGVHLACLAGYLGARAASRILRGEEDETAALTRYEETYRGAFGRYLRFLCFFYDHNADPDSYFWTARRILSHAPAALDARTAFVRLMSGGGDRDATPELVMREQERWADAIRAGRVGALPGGELLRVRTTGQLLRD